METSQKRLKIASIIILVFTFFTLLNLGTEIYFSDFDAAVIPDGAPDNIVLVAKIILASISFLLVLPQIYIGIKGIKIFNAPDSSKGHIVWCAILFAIAIINVISHTVAIARHESVQENVSAVLSFLLEATIFFDYLKYSLILAKEN